MSQTIPDDLTTLSMIRRGNQFLYLPEKHWDGSVVGWLLVDGPWFDMFERTHSDFIRELYSPMCKCPDPLSAVESVKVEFSFLEWERNWWHPGICLSEESARKVSGWGYWLAERFREWNGRRRRHGWRVYGKGIVPAYFNRADWLEDTEQHEHTLRWEEIRCA